ncbi:MAG: SpoIIE family protein phosphatase [Coriobacteriia bacterium]|nr:SpoIIE family protein phosphatase [Coriobacteriia bacterium]
MMENMPEAGLVYLDPDFNFVLVNSTYARGARMSKEELIGRNHFELFPNEENEAIFRKARDTGEPVAFKAKPFVYEHQPWRGVTYWDWTLTPLKAEDGTVRGLVFSLVEVTERVRRQQLAEALEALDGVIHSTLHAEEIMQRLVDAAADAAGCESSAVALRTPQGWSSPYVSEKLLAVAKDRRFSPEETPVAEMAVETRSAVVFHDVSADERVAAALETFGIKSILGVPLFVREEVVGVLGLHYHSEPVGFTEPVVEFAERLAASASLALTNARLYEEEHHAAEVLRGALQRPVPEVPGVDLGVVYRPAHEADRVGGDFYDVFELDGGLVAALVADVSGKGLRAAGMTETARSAARALAYLDPSPAEVLSRLNRALVRQFEPGTFVTALFAVVDPSSGEVRLSSAGHPEPVVCGERARFVDMPPGTVLGAFEGRYAEVTLRLEHETLLMYTDGVTEVRREGRFFGQGRLRRVLGGCYGGGPQALVDGVLGAILDFAGGRLHDDVAMVALRRRP